MNTGPGRNEICPLSRSKTMAPVTSAGRRSAVNCTRPKVRPSERASALASVVLPTPGVVLDQEMALGHETAQRQAHGAVPAHVGAAHVGHHGVEGPGQAGRRRRGGRDRRDRRDGRDAGMSGRVGYREQRPGRRRSFTDAEVDATPSPCGHRVAELRHDPRVLCGRCHGGEPRCPASARHRGRTGGWWGRSAHRLGDGVDRDAVVGWRVPDEERAR